MAPIWNPIRASRISADGVEGVSVVYITPLHGVPLRIRNGAVYGWVLKRGSGPRKEWAVPIVGPLPLVRDVGSTWRAPLLPRLRQPVGLGAGGGRVLPPGFHGADDYARCVCCDRHPSHISRRRPKILVPIVKRRLPKANGAQKLSKYVRPLLDVFRRDVR